MTLLRAQPDSVWKRGYVTAGADLDVIDGNTTVAINGDDGGSWPQSGSLTADFIIGGAGMIACGPWIIPSAGPTTLSIDCDANNRFIFGKGTSDDVFAYTSVGTQDKIQGFFDAVSDTPNKISVRVPAFSTFAPVPPVVTIAGLVILTTSVAAPARFITPMRVYNGTVFTRTIFTFAVGQSHGSAPAKLPQFRVIAVDAAGNITPLRATAPADTINGYGATDDTGFQTMIDPGSGSAYYAAGAAQSITYAANFTHVIDIETYTYFLEVIDETDLSGNTYTSAVSRFSGILFLDGRD